MKRIYIERKILLLSIIKFFKSKWKEMRKLLASYNFNKFIIIKLFYKKIY